MTDDEYKALAQAVRDAATALSDHYEAGVPLEHTYSEAVKVAEGAGLHVDRVVGLPGAPITISRRVEL